MEIIVAENCKNKYWFDAQIDFIKAIISHLLFENHIESLRYFVIADSETETFIETVNEYGTLLHRNIVTENTDQYQVAAQSIEGTDDEGNYCQAIIIKSALLIAIMSLFDKSKPSDEESIQMQAFGITIVMHEIGHAIDNQNIYNSLGRVNTQVAFNLSNPIERESFFTQSSISLWGEFFAERFPYKHFPIFKEVVDSKEETLIECIDNYYGKNISITDRIYRILYFFVHIIARNNEIGFDFEQYKLTGLNQYASFLKEFEVEMFNFYSKYPNCNFYEDISGLKDIYMKMYLFEIEKRKEIQ